MGRHLFLAHGGYGVSDDGVVWSWFVGGCVLVRSGSLGMGVLMWGRFQLAASILGQWGGVMTSYLITCVGLLCGCCGDDVEVATRGSMGFLALFFRVWTQFGETQSKNSVCLCVSVCCVTALFPVG